MKFIEKLDFSTDLNLLLQDLHHIEDSIDWPKSFKSNGRTYHANQIGLTYRDGAEFPWFDAGGSLYDKESKHFIGKEIDFTQWNDVGNYTKTVINSLSKKYHTKFGRIRYMRLMPKTGLSVHSDFEARYHLVLKTNPYCYIAEEIKEDNIAAKCYHIPADGCFYKVDTLRNHFVFNGGWEPRIHLVLAEA